MARQKGPSASLDPTFRSDAPWPEELKRALIERGYALTDEALEKFDEEEGRQGSGQAVGPLADGR